MEKKLTEKDIMEICCGVDNDGENNAVIKVNMSKLDVTTEKETIIHELYLDGPVVNIFRGYRLTQIDLIFANEKNPELMRLIDKLNKFTTIANSIDEETDTIPAIILTIMPKLYEGEYFISALHGAWCLMPNDSGVMGTLRFIFENPLVHVYRVNDSDIDYEDIEKELISENYHTR